MSTGLDAEHSKAVLLVEVRDALDQPGNLVEPGGSVCGSDDHAERRRNVILSRRRCKLHFMSGILRATRIDFYIGAVKNVWNRL
jgi:hypothetical protein